MSEGGIAATLILFEKYEVTGIVYESDTVTVYLTWHIYMSVKRIVKRILKNSVYRDTFYSEVNILKDIKHPNIPTVYDVEEDKQAYYIIEDYIEGYNLDDFIRIHGVMSDKEACDIGIKLCRIISFLHNQKPIPILFLDIHPKNILVNNDKLYLIDFGNALHAHETDKREVLMGTVGYAAPEQYRSESLDERTDIYGIGALLYFLVTGKNCHEDAAKSLIFPQNIPEKFKLIILKCLAFDRNDRFCTIEALKNSLTTMYTEENICICEGKSRIISFAGADRRVGVTHICLAFSSYLASKGYNVLYEESNTSNHLRVIAADKRLRYQNGFFYAGALKCKPLYGEQIILEADCQYIIRDCGVFRDEILQDSDEVILVGGAKAFEREKTIEAWKRTVSAMQDEINLAHIHLICNSGDDKDALMLWKGSEYIGKKAPMIQHLIEYKGHDDVVRQFFDELMVIVGIGKKGGEEDRKGAKFIRKATKKAGEYIGRYIGRS